LFALETAANFRGAWDLFSADCRRALEKTSKIHSAEQYQVYRQELEALWSDFSITGRATERNGSVVYTGRAKIDETGLISDASFRCVVVKESGTWKIDEFTYSVKPRDN
jgi:hypothetical protein